MAVTLLLVTGKGNTVKENCLNKKMALDATQMALDDTHMPPMRHAGYALLCIMKREHRWASAEQSTEAFAILFRMRIHQPQKIQSASENAMPEKVRIIMTNKSEKSLDNYKLVGAEMRLLKEVIVRTYVDAYTLLPASERNKLYRAMSTINEICSRTEDRMYMAYPDIGHDYVDVFYGDLQTKPRTEVDAEVMKLARSIANKILQGAPED